MGDEGLVLAGVHLVRAHHLFEERQLLFAGFFLKEIHNISEIGLASCYLFYIVYVFESN